MSSETPSPKPTKKARGHAQIRGASRMKIPMSALHRGSSQKPFADPSRLLEAATLALLVVMCFWCTSPLLEEWGIQLAFDQMGLLPGYVELVKAAPLRPLHFVPHAVARVFGSGSGGYWIVVATLIVGRYLVVRWAFVSWVPSRALWPLATLGAVLPLWPAIWMGRFLPAQVASILVFLVLGLLIRLRRRGNLGLFLVALAVYASLTTYQAFAIVLVMLPAVVAFVSAQTQSSTHAIRDLLLRGYLAVGGGFAAYAFHVAAVTRWSMNSGYESALLQDSEGVSRLPHQLVLIYQTLFNYSPFAYPVLVLLLLLFLTLVRLPHQGNVSVRQYLGSMGVFVVLPALSLTFLTSLHARDPERVLLPISVGFVIACGALGAATGKRMLLPTGEESEGVDALALGVVSVPLFSALVFAVQANSYKTTQNEVLDQLAGLNLAEDLSLILEDRSGTLGDVYTFYGSTLQEAAALQGLRVRIVLCTPIGIDRVHPIARRYPIATTPDCFAEGSASDDATAIRLIFDGSRLEPANPNR